MPLSDVDVRIDEVSQIIDVFFEYFCVVASYLFFYHNFRVTLKVFLFCSFKPFCSAVDFFFISLTFYFVWLYFFCETYHSFRSTNWISLTVYLQYQTVLQTNADGTFSLIQVDPSTLSNNPSIITLPDGTTAQVQGVATVSWNWRFIFYRPSYSLWMKILLKIFLELEN